MRRFSCLAEDLLLLDGVASLNLDRAEMTVSVKIPMP
jgi:hypothetical protein